MRGRERLAGRTRRIDSSGIRKVFNLAATLEQPINLSIGQPHFDVPDEVKEAAVKAIREGKNRYTLTEGIPPLVEAVREMLKRKKGVEPEKVMITSGVSGGLLLALTALVEEGDEVIVFDPYFVMYKHLINLLGGTPVFVSTYPDFSLDPARIEEVITPRTRLMILNTPANPTGKVYTRREIEAVVSLAEEHGLLILSDEIYDEFVYDAEMVSPASFYDNTLLLGGFSKSHAMTGWRIGYAAGPSELIEAMTMLQQFSFVCAPSFAQEAALTALQTDVSGMVEEYRRRRDVVYEGLKERFDVVRPEGAFYIFPAAPGGDATAFVQTAITEESLLVIPGSVFSEQDTHFRIAYTAPWDVLERGVEKLCRLAERFDS